MENDANDPLASAVEPPAAAESAAPARDRVRVNLMLSRDTHARVRWWCLQRGVTMQSALEKMLDSAFDKVVPP